MTYKQFSIEERETIQVMLWKKCSVRAIARKLGRSPSSVSREIKRNNPKQSRRYTPRKAHARALKKRQSRGRKERLKNEMIRTYVTTHLMKQWSPEQIAGRIKKDNVGSISHEAIYQYVYHQIHRNGWGLVKPDCLDLRPCLRRKQKRRRRKGGRASKRVLASPGRSIETRPVAVRDKARFGDWEGDTVESVHHKPGVNTLLERKSGLYFVTKVRDKTGAGTTEAVKQRFDSLAPQLKRTLTLDNGPENRDWRELEKHVGVTTYFAHPYSSHERGANENANGLLRQYFPKGTDFTTVSDDQIAKAEYALNTRPRKRLGWKTPLEVIGVAVGG